MCQTAPNDVLLEITYIAATFHPLVLQVDTVRAYHFGSKYIVEVDIVLPPTMTHKESHDIGDELQQKLESLPNVLRAYVHLDWYHVVALQSFTLIYMPLHRETAHKPEYARAHAINVKKDS
jgi:divalent metal cation (Fe/Co/Zn/Cd) transporter